MRSPFLFFPFLGFFEFGKRIREIYEKIEKLTQKQLTNVKKKPILYKQFNERSFFMHP